MDDERTPTPDEAHAALITPTEQRWRERVEERFGPGRWVRCNCIFDQTGKPT
jgi:hypothetical protein